MSFWRWIKQMSSVRRHEPRDARLCLEALEDRLLLAATYTWCGGADGLWSDKNDWKSGGVVGVGVPGAADTALFDGTNNNNSKMDLQTNVSVLKIQGYTGTISLQRQLILDVLTMSSGTIKRDSTWLGGDGTLFDMKVSQAAGSATNDVSNWTGGTIGPGDTSSFVFTMSGTADKPLTFNVGSTTSTPTFAGNQWFVGGGATVNWKQGNVKMAYGGATFGGQILNQGTFNAESPGTISSPAGTTWEFKNIGTLKWKGAGQFPNGRVRNRPGATIQKVSADDGTPGSFAVAEIDQEGGYLEIDSGTVLVNGAFTQSDGDSVVESGTALTVSGDDVTLSGGTMEIAGAVDTDSSFLEEGGTLTLEDGALSAATGLQVQAGATLSGTGSATATVSTAGQVTVGWVESQNGDTLTVTGAYTQSGGDTDVPQGATLDVFNGDVTLSAGTLEADGALTGSQDFRQNAGNVTVGADGALTALNQYVENNGTLAVQGGTLASGLPLLVEPQGVLGGRGTVEADLYNYGNVTVGQGGTGTLAVSGHYVQFSGTTGLVERHP